MRQARRARWAPGGGWLALTALALCALAGCGSPTASHTAPTTCHASHLTLALLSTDDASGRRRFVYQLTNNGTSNCTLRGYPGVTGMGASVAITQTASAYTWATAAITTQTLAAGGSAVFAIQAQPTAELAGQTCVTATPSFTPPGDTGGLASPVPITTCDGALSVSPVVATPSAL